MTAHLGSFTPRRLRRLAVVVVAVFGIYLLAGNVFLNTALGPWAINRKPDRFQLDWSHGATWWPGYVALWNVQAKGHVQRVLWQAAAAKARGRIAVLPLFARELRVASIDVDEVSGGLERSAERMLPPPARAGGWSLRFDRIATQSLRHARIGGIDLQTDGMAEFGFIKQLRGGPMEILPSRVALADVHVRHAGHELLQEGRIEAGFSIARHRREDAAGLAKLALMDATLSVHGRLPALAVELDPAGRWRGSISQGTQAGQLDLSLDLQRGVLQPGGVMDLRVPLDATRNGSTLNELASVHAEVRDDGVQLQLQLPPPPEGQGSANVDVLIALHDLRALADPRALLAQASGSLDLDWHFDSLHWLGPLLVKTPWLVLEGAGRVQAELKLAAGQLQPGSRVDIPAVQLAATVAGHRFSGSARAEGRLEAGKNGKHASVQLLLASYQVVAEDAPDKALMRGRDLRIDLDAAGELHDFRESLAARLRFERAEMPDLRAVNAWLPGDSLQLLGGRTHLAGDLQLDAAGRIGQGRIGLQGRAARVRFADLRMAGDFDLDARIGGSDLATRSFDLGNTRLQLRNVSLLDAERTAGQNWWANLTLKRGRVKATRPFQVDAHVDMEMQNVGLLLALFARHRDYPAWTLKLADAGTLHANARLRMDGQSLVFDRVQASNDRFDVKARLRVAAGKPRGDLLLHWRRLGLGLEIDRGEHQFHLLRAREWYEARPHLLDAP